MVFGGRRVRLYGSYDLIDSQKQYLEDARSLGLTLAEGEADFTAFEEGPTLESVLDKIAAGESWG